MARRALTKPGSLPGLNLSQQDSPGFSPRTIFEGQGSAGAWEKRATAARNAFWNVHTTLPFL